ncbi:MAG: LapA family protein [Patescibacteria group bacterium]
MTLILFLLGFILGAGAIIFAVQNTEVVALTFMHWQFETSLALLIIAAIAVGMIISLLALLPSVISESFRMRNLQNQNKKLVQELEEREQALLLARSGTTSPPQATEPR